MDTNDNNPINDNNLYEFLKNWLLYSSIFINDDMDDNCGGVYGWENGFLYPEITGYYLTWLVYELHIEPKNKRKLLSSIQKTTNWIIHKVIERGKLYAKYYVGTSQIDKQQYVFDICMIGNGLINAYRILKQEKILHHIKDIHNKIISIIETNDEIPWYIMEKYNRPNAWSTQNGVFLAKITLFLMNYNDLFPDIKAIRLIESILHKYKTKLENTDFVITDNNSKTTYLHAFFYALEAYWVGGRILGKSLFIDMVRNKLLLYKIHVSKYGFSGLLDESGSTLLDGIGGDAISQYIRLHHLVFTDTSDDINAFEHLKNNNLYIEKNIAAVRYGYSIHNKYHSDLNTWATLFLCQGISLKSTKNKDILMSNAHLFI